MKSKRLFSKKPLSRRLVSLPPYLLIFVLVSVAFYATIDKLANLNDNLGILISFNRNPFGFYFGAISIGYLTIGLVVILVSVMISSHRTNLFRLSKVKGFVVIVLALILGGALAASQAGEISPSFPNHISDSGGGFTLNVYYGTTSFSMGKNISIQYILKNDAYTNTLYYLYFGGQFSMVFHNSLGQQVSAYKVPISFKLNPGQTSIEFVPGETWTTILSWNGSINNTSTLAPTGNYTLASYAVLQDANVSLYIVLQTPNITVSFNN
jgi:hypothetical protein